MRGCPFFRVSRGGAPTHLHVAYVLQSSRAPEGDENTPNVRLGNVPQWVAEFAASPRTLREILPVYAEARVATEISRASEAQRKRWRTDLRLLFSWPPHSPVTVDQALRDVSEWMEQVAPRAEYIAVAHTNRRHLHVHLVVFARDLDGRKVNFEPREFRSLGRRWNEIYCRRTGHPPDDYLARIAGDRTPDQLRYRDYREEPLPLDLLELSGEAAAYERAASNHHMRPWSVVPDSTRLDRALAVAPPDTGPQVRRLLGPAGTQRLLELRMGPSGARRSIQSAQVSLLLEGDDRLAPEADWYPLKAVVRDLKLRSGERLAPTIEYLTHQALLRTHRAQGGNWDPITRTSGRDRFDSLYAEFVNTRQARDAILRLKFHHGPEEARRRIIADPSLIGISSEKSPFWRRRAGRKAEAPVEEMVDYVIAADERLRRLREMARWQSDQGRHPYALVKRLRELDRATLLEFWSDLGSKTLLPTVVNTLAIARGYDREPGGLAIERGISL